MATTRATRVREAAPEMLALLKEFHECLDRNDLNVAMGLGLDVAVIEARALLARIEGKEPTP